MPVAICIRRTKSCSVPPPPPSRPGVSARFALRCSSVPRAELQGRTVTDFVVSRRAGTPHSRRRLSRPKWSALAGRSQGLPVHGALLSPPQYTSTVAAWAACLCPSQQNACALSIEPRTICGLRRSMQLHDRRLAAIPEPVNPATCEPSPLCQDGNRRSRCLWSVALADGQRTSQATATSASHCWRVFRLAAGTEAAALLIDTCRARDGWARYGHGSDHFKGARSWRLRGVADALDPVPPTLRCRLQQPVWVDAKDEGGGVSTGNRGFIARARLTACPVLAAGDRPAFWKSCRSKLFVLLKLRHPYGQDCFRSAIICVNRFERRPRSRLGGRGVFTRMPAFKVSLQHPRVGFCINYKPMEKSVIGLPSPMQVAALAGVLRLSGRPAAVVGIGKAAAGGSTGGAVAAAEVAGGGPPPWTESGRRRT